MCDNKDIVNMSYEALSFKARLIKVLYNIHSITVNNMAVK